MVTDTTSLRAQAVLNELKKCGIEYIVWLPDSEARFMYDAISQEKDLKLVQVCREGEAFGVATGLYLGGKEPVVLIQNTGMFESGDAIRGLILGLKVPILIMVGYRGFRRDGPITDTAAIFTEPILDAWGIPHYTVETDADMSYISQAHHEAKASGKPVAILIAREYE